MKEISLRAATLDDAAFLLAVRNDPLTRAMSRHTLEVPEPVHQMWLEDTLASRRHFLYVATLFGVVPVGTARMDVNQDDTQFSLAVDPGHRGKGYGRLIVRALCEHADAVRGSKPQVAEISTANMPSALAFLREGFEPCEVVDDHRLVVEGLNSGRRWLWVRREAGGQP